MRVLLISDLAHTGFGRVGRELGTGLIAKGHDIRIIGINWRGIPEEIAARIRKPSPDPLHDRLAAASAELIADPLIDFVIAAGEGGDGMGHNLSWPAMQGQVWPGWKPEAVIVVADPKAMLDRLARDQGAFAHAREHGIPCFNYVPIEGTGIPLSWRAIYEKIDPVAMSSFGQAQLEGLLGRPVPLATHGVSKVFRPVTPTDPIRLENEVIQSKDAAKDAIGARGQTVILRTDRYIFRKNYPAFFRVVRPVWQAHPDLRVLIHTALIDEYGDIRESMSREPGAVYAGGIDWWHPQITLTKKHDTYTGLTDEGMRLLYCAADLYVTPTMAEGFGLCLAESLACGTPVVATDYSAIAEVVGPGGPLIPPRDYITNAYAHEWALVDEAAMSAAVERLVSKPRLRRELGEAGRRHVAQFTWQNAVDVFDQLIQQQAAVAA